MTDRAKKVTELTALTTATGDDLLLIVNDPGGTPESRKITVANFVGNVASNSAFRGTLTVNGSVTIAGNTLITKPLVVSNTVSVSSNLNVSGFVTIANTPVINSTGYWVGSTSGLKGDKGDTPSVPGPYTDDADAADNSVAVGGLYYRSTGIVYIRLT